MAMNSNLSLSHEAPKFFKIVVNPPHQKLRIPKEFMRRYGYTLSSDKVYLKTPSGSIREVGLVHSNGETWLHKGWKDFREYYSIRFGHLLVFQYAGNSHFDVLIFDMTATEIEYPPLHNAVGHEAITNFNMANSNRVPEIVAIKSESESESESDDSFASLEQFSRSLKRKTKTKIVEKVDDHKVQTIVDKKANIAYQRAKSFKSCNPFCIYLMQPSYVSPAFVLSISSTFAKKNLPGKQNDLKLRNLDGKIWSVRCNVGPMNAKISGGWKEFVQDNNLKVGDVCVFEVNKRNQLLWNVIIFRC